MQHENYTKLNSRPPLFALLNKVRKTNIKKTFNQSNRSALFAYASAVHRVTENPQVTWQFLYKYSSSAVAAHNPFQTLVRRSRRWWCCSQLSLSCCSSQRRVPRLKAAFVGRIATRKCRNKKVRHCKKPSCR